MGVNRLSNFLQCYNLWKTSPLYFLLFILMYRPEGTAVIIDCDNMINFYYKQLCEAGDFDVMVTNNAIKSKIINLRDYLEYNKLKVVCLCCDCTNKCGKLEELFKRGRRKESAITYFNEHFLTNADEHTRNRKLPFTSIVRWKFITAFEEVFGLPLHHKGRNVDGYVYAYILYRIR